MKHPYFSPYSFQYFGKELPPWDNGRIVKLLAHENGKTYLMLSDNSRWFLKEEKYLVEKPRRLSIFTEPVPSLEWPGLFEINALDVFSGQVLPLVGNPNLNWWDSF